MSERVRGRLRKAEKRLSAEANVRRGYSLEQLLRAARGEELGPPSIVLRAGEPSLEDLLAAHQPPEH